MKYDIQTIFSLPLKGIHLVLKEWPLIWAYPENLVKIGLMVEAMDTLCGRAWDRMARDGTR